MKLTLDLNSNWVSHGTLASDKQVSFCREYVKRRECLNQAALVVLGGPRDFPSLRVSNLLVAPGRETWVEVRPSDDNGCADGGDGPVVFSRDIPMDIQIYPDIPWI